jgi:hypothetical protein
MGCREFADGIYGARLAAGTIPSFKKTVYLVFYYGVNKFAVQSPKKAC